MIYVLWSSVMLLLGLAFFFGGVQYMQYFYIECDHIIVKSALGTIVELNLYDSVARTETLPTYFSWVFTIDKKWICFYDKSIASSSHNRFNSGCANRKNAKRVQIIDNKENRKAIEQFIKIDDRLAF